MLPTSGWHFPKRSALKIAWISEAVRARSKIAISSIRPANDDVSNAGPAPVRIWPTRIELESAAYSNTAPPSVDQSTVAVSAPST